jgi:hypothetical protein
MLNNSRRINYGTSTHLRTCVQDCLGQHDSPFADYGRGSNSRIRMNDCEQLDSVLGAFPPQTLPIEFLANAQRHSDQTRFCFAKKPIMTSDDGTTKYTRALNRLIAIDETVDFVRHHKGQCVGNDFPVAAGTDNNN